jgi:hypothetical protein
VPRNEPDHVADAALRAVLRGGTAPDGDADLVFSVGDVYACADRPAGSSEPPSERLFLRSPARFAGVKYGGVALVAMLAVALLAGPFYARAGRGAGSPSAGPAPDPVSGAYLSTLRTYYVPMVTASGPAKGCLNVVALAQPEMRAHLMATCRPLVAAGLAAARACAARLATARVPQPWRAQGAALDQATLALGALLTAQLRDIDAHDVSRFVDTEDWTTSTLDLFLEPIAQINSQIDAGPPPLPAPLPLMGTDFT